MKTNFAYKQISKPTNTCMYINSYLYVPKLTRYISRVKERRKRRGKT